MARIETYPEVTPTAQDLIILTDVSDNNETKAATIADLFAINAGTGFPGTLQQVTDAGASTTNGISVNGSSTFSGNLTSSGTLFLSGGVRDSANSLGTSGQALITDGANVTWTTLSVPTLQQVTSLGDTTTDDITVGGLTSTGTNSFQASTDFLSEIRLSGSAGTSGQVLTSAGAGNPPTWTTPTGAFNLGAADQTITGARVVNGGSNTLTFTGLSQFNVTLTPTVSIDGSTIATVKSATETVLESTALLKIRTPNIVAASATAGQWMRLTATTGEVEYSKLTTGSDVSDYVPKFDDDGLIMSRSSLQDDGTTAGFNATPNASRQVSIATTLGEGLRITQTGTTNPVTSIAAYNSGATATAKYGIRSDVYGGTAGAEQVGGQFSAGTQTYPTLTDIQVGILGVAGALSSQTGYGAYLHAKESSAGDNVGLKIDVANAGAGNAYLGQWTDGNEAVGKVPVCQDANGNVSWASLSSANISAEETSGASNVSISTPTALIYVHRVTAIGGGGNTKTLPDPSGLSAGQLIYVIDDSGSAGTNNITVDQFNTETISGQPSVVIAIDYGVAKLYFNGTNYNLL